jgi:ATP-dependent Clp protease ATP-binding subunit ClpX
MTTNAGAIAASLHCSFCGKSQHEVETLIAGAGVAICDECNADVTAAIASKAAKAKRMARASKVPTPREIDQHLAQYVIGQERARRTLSVAVRNHYVRLEEIAKGSKVELTKSNIMLIGPTGTGKTYIAKALADMLDVPFTIADATTLTEAGYVGDDVESIMLKLYQAAGGNVEKAQRGIVYIDEVDKLARKGDSASITKEVGGEGVQQALLKLIEGTICSLPPNGGRKNPEASLIQMDTSQVLFICGGAFPGLERIIAQRLDDKSIGFGSRVDAGAEKTASELIALRRPEDLTAFGMIPEFIGRLPVIATLDELDIDAMVRILTEPKNAIVKQFQHMFGLQNVELRFSDDGLREIARAGMDRKTGARGLRSIIEDMLTNTMFDLPDIGEEVEAVEIDGTSVKTSSEPRRIPRGANDVEPLRQAG